MCHCTTISFFLKKEKDFLFKKRLWKIVRRNIGWETTGISLGVFTTIDTITINTKEEESLSLFIKHHSHHVKSKWPQKTNRSSPFWQSLPCGEDGSSPLPFRGKHSSVLAKDLFGEKIFWQNIFLFSFLFSFSHNHISTTHFLSPPHAHHQDDSFIWFWKAGDAFLQHERNHPITQCGMKERHQKR